MSDIVERLRSTTPDSENYQWLPTKLLHEAADEIDRLRADNEWMRAELKKVADLIASDASKRP